MTDYKIVNNICHGYTLTCVYSHISLVPADLSVSTRKAKPAGAIKSHSVHRLGTAYLSKMVDTRYCLVETLQEPILTIYDVNVGLSLHNYLLRYHNKQQRVSQLPRLRKYPLG